MRQNKKFTLPEMDGYLKTYFAWSVNALRNPASVDEFLKAHKSTITRVAQELLKETTYVPGKIYRGIILRQQVDSIMPLNKIQFLSFSTQRKVAEHFADIKGFGSDTLDVEKQLGSFGYVIEYTPKVEEIIFHYSFLSLLPYAELFTVLGMEGDKEIEFLTQQYEVMILQPQDPFKHLTPMFK